MVVLTGINGNIYWGFFLDPLADSFFGQCLYFLTSTHPPPPTTTHHPPTTTHHHQ
jgi:hypothetical protein